MPVGVDNTSGAVVITNRVTGAIVSQIVRVGVNNLGPAFAEMLKWERIEQKRHLDKLEELRTYGLEQSNKNAKENDNGS